MFIHIHFYATYDKLYGGNAINQLTQVRISLKYHPSHI